VGVYEADPEFFQLVWLVLIHSQDGVIIQIADFAEWAQELSWSQTTAFHELGLRKLAREHGDLWLEVLTEPLSHPRVVLVGRRAYTLLTLHFSF